jgi:hypothetical protein
MIKCSNCREITITRTVSGDFVCNNCGVEWKDNGISKYGPKCIRCGSTATVADFYALDFVTMRCEDCDYIWDEAIIPAAVSFTGHKSKMAAFDMNEQDAVNHPQHYANGMTVEVECIMFTRWLDFDLGNAFKYVWRSGSKDDAVQDLEKAVWYLEDAIVYGITCCEKELLPFLPKSSLPEWKYDTLRCILNGKVEDARLKILEHLNSVKPAHNNRKR